MPRFDIGSLVRCREREWVVLPSDDQDIMLLRPLGGIEAETCGIYLPIEGSSVHPSSFPPPDPQRASDFVSGWLLRDAARLTLRSGAGPFRALGRLGVRPRPYQLVPLLMALRLDSVRLLIADDVGIGKTIEAGLIARELLDRGEIHRLVVLCPPHLCDQWQRELAEKFALDAVVVRSSTAAALERTLPRGDTSVFEHYPFTVASIDYVKSDRRRESFLRTCPEFVIVDEAHTATDTTGGAAQQRYELVRDLAKHADRHLVLLTATPHSGIEDAFRSLLALLDQRFAAFDLQVLSETQRDDLARHFVQRRRADVQRWLGQDDETPFPTRVSTEVTYMLNRVSEYRALFEDVYRFTRELVQSSGLGATHTWQQRARYWAALALLRCVMSSPAAAEKALRVRAAGADVPLADDDQSSDALWSSYVYDPTDQEGAPDLEPTHIVEQGSPVSERARLQRFAARAAALRGNHDPKLLALVPLLNELLRDGFRPIVYCRYIATANYLAEELVKRLAGSTDLRVLSVTGERSEEEREQLIAELEQSPRRVLVATDCLSEGINLQHAFDTVIHYDLPWNPNRLEQREGRVDRYGQPATQVRTALIYSKDNPMDEAVMNVLIRKAVAIHRALGISVPLPADSATVVAALITSLFQPTPQQVSMFDTYDQLTLNAANASVLAMERDWDMAVEREKESRTRFAQRRIKPEEVARELEETDAVLGDAATVAAFVSDAAQRLGAPVEKKRHTAKGARVDDTYTLDLHKLPLAVRERLTIAPRRTAAKRTTSASDLMNYNVSAQSLTRNHPLVTALADYLLETALAPQGDAEPSAARSSLIRTTAVSRRTVLLLLRVRMLIERVVRGAEAKHTTLAEELVVCGYTRSGGVPVWLAESDVLALLASAQPSANVARDERTLGIESALGQLAEISDDLHAIAQQRADRLRESHQRVRSATSGGRVTVRPHLPADVLGMYVLVPVLH